MKIYINVYNDKSNTDMIVVILSSEVRFIANKEILLKNSIKKCMVHTA